MSILFSDDIYRQLLMELTEGIILTNPDGNIVFVNSAAEKIRNVQKDNLMGNNVLDCHSSNSKTKVSRAIDFLRTNPNKSFNRMVNDTVNNKIYQNTYTGIYNENKEILGMAVITKDITMPKRLEESQANTLRTQEIVLDNFKQQYQDLLMSSMEMLSNLLEARDEYTNGHSKRVADISSKLYNYKYGINQTYLDIRWAAKLHDIGKICIPDQIVNKSETLTSEEYSIIKQHSQIASEIVKPLDPGNRITPFILHHHERFDGKGYPDYLSGDNIPLGSRIISIADSYDAMRSCRSYRAPLSYEKCIEEIENNSGTQFDPEWVEVFVDLARTGSID